MACDSGDDGARMEDIKASHCSASLLYQCIKQNACQLGLDHGVGHPIRLWPGTSTSALEDRSVGGRKRNKKVAVHPCPEHLCLQDTRRRAVALPSKR